MKIRKDKINTAVYEAMRKAQNHPQIQKLLNQCEVGRPETHCDDFDMEYMSQEHRLHQYFITTWAAMIPQLKEKFGPEEAIEINERLKKVFCCRGLVYNTKNSFQCHHPLCPMCHHRKHYRTIKDLKPYLDEKTNDLYVIRESEFVPFDQIPMAMLVLEQRAKKITKAMSSLTEQWILLPRIRIDKQTKTYEASFVILAVGKKANTVDIMKAFGRHTPVEPCNTRFKAILDNIRPLTANTFGYDPLLLKHGGIQAMELWDRQAPGFRYRTKVAHR
jgi:hypothetical protein